MGCDCPGERLIVSLGVEFLEGVDDDGRIDGRIEFLMALTSTLPPHYSGVWAP